MGSWVAKNGSSGWVGVIPLVVAAVLWLAVLAGVASPLARWVSDTDTLAQLAKEQAGGAPTPVKQTCVGAALRTFGPRR